jgi:hypothetical protein
MQEHTAVAVWLDGLHLPEYKDKFHSAGYVNLSDMSKLTKEEVYPVRFDFVALANLHSPWFRILPMFR